MIEKIHIQNFKSIYDLELEVGRVNVFIGENGSGKSNLLEALVFVSASESNMLSNEFLFPRGMRVPEPQLMRSAFFEDDREKNITVNISFDKDTVKEFEFENNNTEYSKWIDTKSLVRKKEIYHASFLVDMYKTYPKGFTDELSESMKELKYFLKLDTLQIEKFIIYSPEHEELRNFTDEGQIQPLGVKGEGLYKLLKVVNSYEDKSYIKTIIESLQLFDWFDDIVIPDDLAFGEKKLVIKDKYLYKEIDQRSTNEGFLFILFYVTLIVAKETPKAFAIDNIDSFLNPKLCTRLMKLVVELAKKYDKQIFLTTHNPAILDGINLSDDEQKLFVVSRDDLGHTQTDTLSIEDNPIDEDGERLHLSEAFLRGYLGGLPRGF